MIILTATDISCHNKKPNHQLILRYYSLKNIKKMKNIIHKSQMSEMTHKEIQKAILKNNNIISGWITFMGIISLIGLIGAILLVIKTN